MRLFGLTITRAEKALQPVDNRGGWWGIIREAMAGNWQSNIEIKLDTVLTYNAVYACVTLIASDIAKLRPRLMVRDEGGIWTEAEAQSPFRPVLRKPNHYQTRIEFFQQWVTSKLVHGNAYVLKVRDARRVVTGLYVLDPQRVTPLVAENGDVFYQIQRDDLSGVAADVIAVPAEDIIHDKMNALYHPLVGVSPIYACGLAATQGLRIQTNSANFFGNAARPGGMLTAPGEIKQATAERLKAYWEAEFAGHNAGRVAVLGDGLKYEPMMMTATDAQLIEQLKWTAETVCSCFHVPPYMVGIGGAPTYNNVEALNQQYYSQCLQVLIESIEVGMDEGLSLPAGYGVEFDLDDLLRMDTATKVKTAVEGIRGGLFAPNEGRRKFDLRPVEGGDTPYLQHQDYSLAALAERDRNSPFAKPEPAALPPPDEPTESEARAALVEIHKGLAA